MNEFKSYFTRHSREFKDLFTDLSKEARKTASEKGKYDSSHEEDEKKYTGRSSLYFFFVFFALPFSSVFSTLLSASWVLLLLAGLLSVTQ